MATSTTRILLPADSQEDTLIVSQNPRLRRTAENLASKADDVMNRRQVILLIRNLCEEIFLTETASIILGRSNPQQKFYPEVDLTPYGGRTKGVSRAHARLHLQDDHLYITDLCSDNGTYVAGQRLVPDNPHRLRRGDEVTLGCLCIRVLFS